MKEVKKAILESNLDDKLKKKLIPLVNATLGFMGYPRSIKKESLLD